jgi:16S rRNA processing protein RimM
MVVVGRIARTHGRRGEVIVNLETDFPERRFRRDGIVYVIVAGDLRALRIEESRLQSGRPVIAVEGFGSITEAEALVGYELRVPMSEQQPLPDGAYYEHALVGCAVRTVDDVLVGTVVAVQGVAGASRLIVQATDTDDEIDIPLADPICVRVEPGLKRVVINPPSGLLELNRRDAQDARVR